jgi:hypothetical protein
VLLVEADHFLTLETPSLTSTPHAKLTGSQPMLQIIRVIGSIILVHTTPTFRTNKYPHLNVVLVPQVIPTWLVQWNNSEMNLKKKKLWQH